MLRRRTERLFGESFGHERRKTRRRLRKRRDYRADGTYFVGKKVARILDDPNVKYVGNADKKISKVIVCSGAGARDEELIEYAKANFIDCVIGGESKISIALRVIDLFGFALIDVGHFESEIFCEKILSEWLEDNREIIQSEYLCYLGKDNKCILETGKRNNDKVALVEHQFKDGTKEYIVAFHYEVDDKKVNWGYGYYYGDDLKKAKEDFEKVKAGGNLADTFKLQTSENDEVRETVENKKEFIEQVMKKQKKSKEKER